MTKAIKSTLIQHLEHLSVKIGPRPSGSPGNHAAAEYIQGVFQAVGLTVETQPYACPAWKYGETHLTLNSETLAAAPNAFSPLCDVSAALVPVSTVAELERAELSGKIALLYGNLTKSPIAAKGWFLKSERDTHIVQLLEDKTPAALLTVSARPGDLERIIEDADFHIPSASVNAETGQVLLRHPQATVHLRIESERSQGQACNVIAQKPPSTGKTMARATRIVMCAHYDTKIDTPGASDNASGVAVLLTLAQQLSQMDHRHHLEWVAFSGEEYLPMGDNEYVKRYEEHFKDMVNVINFDGAGNRLSASSITTIACSEAFHDHITKVTQPYPGVVWVDPWPESNHSSFTWRGVPAIAFSSSGGSNLAHLRADTLDNVNPDKLVEIVALAIDIITKLQDKSPDWGRAPQTT